MRYAITHRTRFAYDSPAHFARCNVRLRPLDGEGQRVDAHALSITPAAHERPLPPSGFPVIACRITVDRPSSELVVESRATVAVWREAPVADPADPDVAQAGAAARAAADLSALAPAQYLFPSPRLPAFAEIAGWCAAELRPTRGVVDAALALARAIRRDFHYDGQATTLDTSPAVAFAGRHGVCQDFAQIMVSGARSAGLAAAYVSGYLRTDPPPGRERLVGADATHAWAMIWCGPGLGWLGFDPTNGTGVGADHVIAGIGRDYGDVAPIDGTFLGCGGQRIAVSVDVRPLDGADGGDRRSTGGIDAAGAQADHAGREPRHLDRVVAHQDHG